MTVSPERRAAIEAEVDELFGLSPMPKPKVVARDDLGIIRDADVHVSSADPNAAGRARTVVVRRPDWLVTINEAAYANQRADEDRSRAYHRSLDPCRLGLYGPIDED